MDTYNWSGFKKRILINATARIIYEALATPSGLEKWFLRKALFTRTDNSTVQANTYVEKGDTYSWYWHGYNDDIAEQGTILEANGKDFFQFTFGQAGTVSIYLIEEKSKIMLELVQEYIPVDADSKVKYHLGCATGWVFYLANIKSLLEGGLDLRNKDLEIKDVINS